MVREKRVKLSPTMEDILAKICAIIIVGVGSLVIVGLLLLPFGLGAFGAEPKNCNLLNAYQCANANTQTIHSDGGLIDQLFAHDMGITANANVIQDNTAAIQTNTSRIDAAFTELNALSNDVDALASGVAMAVAIANAPVVTAPGKHFSLSGGVGYFHDKFATAIKFAVVPTDFTAVNVSVGYDFDQNVTVGAGAGFAF